MNTDQDILDYLNSYSGDDQMIDSDRHQQLVGMRDKIFSFSNKAPDVERLKLLNNTRLFSSNTLKNSESQDHLNSWNNAQSQLYKFLVAKDFLNLEDITLLNSIITNSDSHIRDFEITTGAGTYLGSEKLPKALENFKANLIKYSGNPTRLAFETYLNLVTIHPFENGNGRTARLAADFYLLKNNILPVCFKSPVQSHVALVKNNVRRKKDESYLKFLEAINFSYQLVFE